MTESIHNAENMLYLTVGHIIGILDDIRTSIDSFAYDMKLSTTKIVDFTYRMHEGLYTDTDMECFIEMLLSGDKEFLDVLGKAEENYTIDVLIIDRATEIVEVVERVISKDPIKYAGKNSLSRGVSQYAQAILSQDG